MFLFRVKIPIFVLDNPVLALCVTKENNSVTHNNPTNLTQFVKTQLEGVDKSMKVKFAFIFSGSIFLTSGVNYFYSALGHRDLRCQWQELSG